MAVAVAMAAYGVFNRGFVMKFFISALAVLFLVGCNTYAVKNSRIASSVVGSEFNSLASKYYERPTHLTVSNMSDGSQMLVISMDKYGEDRGNPTADAYLLSGYIDRYLEAIDKFLRWNNEAMKHKDIVNKKINQFPALAGMTQQFSFYSGNEARHYLVLELCSLGFCNEQIYLTRDSAEKLKDELVRFKVGQLQVGLKGKYD